MSKLKQNIQENGGFQHWFVNVFWYHYKWPLLIGVVVLCPMVMKITKNYVNRKIKGIPEEPVLSHFPDIQAEAAASQTDEV